jgi:transcriptional regulator with XRE-family HTH domain
MKDRIAKIIREEGMTAAKFAEEIGVQASGISHILSGRNNPSTDFLIKILDRFRGINSEWLLLGKGNMYKTGASGAGDFIEKPTKSSENNLFTAALRSPESKSIDEKQTLNTEQREIAPELLVTEAEKPSNSAFSSTDTTKPYEKPLTDKKVERIVIFFNDNTFESYNPNK